jgi:hypothetical protein
MHFKIKSLTVDVRCTVDVKCRRFIPHHSLRISNPYDLQYPSIFEFVLNRNGWRMMNAPSSWRCWSAKSNIGSSHSLESWFHKGTDEIGFEIPGTGRPSGWSTRIKSTQWWFLEDPLCARLLLDEPCSMSNACKKRNNFKSKQNWITKY